MSYSREKSTVYIDEDLKQEVQIKLIKERKSLSDLINELLAEWIKTH